MDILKNVPVIYLTEEQIQRIKLDQRARRLEPDLSNAEAEEMWHLLHEEPEYAEKILNYWEAIARYTTLFFSKNGDAIRLRRRDDGNGWEDVGWNDDDD